MAQVYSIDGVEIENRVRTTADPSGVEGLPSSAWYGEAMIAGVTIEDPEGELDLMGWHTFTHDETDCTGSERTFTGWITGKDISRGAGRQPTGAARIWDCEIIDQNAVWKLKLFRAASAQRPAESDIARMDFMRQSAPMAATPVADNGRWNVTDNPTNFGAASYVAQYPIDLANSVAGVSGKNFYAYWDDAASEISGHYDLAGANPLSTIAISNVIADHDSTTVYPLLDATLTRSPEDQVNGVLYQYIGNQYVYVQDPDLFGPGEFSPENFDRDVLYSTDRVGLLATAQTQAAAQLAARSTEKDTLVVTVLLPPAQVNLLHAGMRVSSKFSHLPGYEDFVDLAVIRRNVIPPRVVGGDYTVRLELSNAVAPTGPGGGDPGDFPPPPPETCDPTSRATVQSGSALSASGGIVTLGAPLTVGNTLVVWIAARTQTSDWALEGGISITGNVDPQEASFQQVRGSMWYMPVIEATDEITITFGSVGAPRVQYVEIEGELQLVDYGTMWCTDQGCTDPFPIPFGFGGVTLTEDAVVIGGYVARLNVSDSFDLTADAPAVQLAEASGSSQAQTWLGRLDATGGGTFDFDGTVTTGGCLRGYVAAMAAFSCTPEDLPCLGPGQPSGIESPTPDTNLVAGDTITTRCPFADNSLVVYLDAMPQPGTIATADGATGEFTLTFDVDDALGERLTVEYLGR